MFSIIEAFAGIGATIFAFLGFTVSNGSEDTVLRSGKVSDTPAVSEVTSSVVVTEELTKEQLKYNDLFLTLVNTLKVETYNFDTLITALVKVREGYSIRQLSGIPQIGVGFVSGCVRDWSAKIGKAKLVEYANELYSLDSKFMLGVASEFIPHQTKAQKEWSMSYLNPKNITQELDYTMSKTENEMMHEYLQSDYEEAVRRGDFDEPERTEYGLPPSGGGTSTYDLGGLSPNGTVKGGLTPRDQAIVYGGMSPQEYDEWDLDQRDDPPAKGGNSQLIHTNLWDFQDGSPLNNVKGGD